MKAKDVYNQYKRDIKVLSDAMRKEGKHGHLDVKGILVTSYQPFEKELDILSSEVVFSEIMGNHTQCQVIPVGNRDLRLTCIQTEDDKTKHISKCVLPIAKDIIYELDDIANEQDKVTHDMIKKVMNKEITNEEASRIINEKLAKSFREEKEVINHYINYRNSHCGKINKTLSKIETHGDKVIEVETKTTKQIEL